MTLESMQKKHMEENLPVHFVHLHSSRMKKDLTNMFLINTRMKWLLKNHGDGTFLHFSKCTNLTYYNHYEFYRKWKRLALFSQDKIDLLIRYLQLK